MKSSGICLGLSALLLALACGSAEHANNDDSASGGTAAGGANSSGGRSGATAGAAGAIPIEALAEPWTSAVCAYFARCLPYDPFAHVPGGCVGVERPRFENGSIPKLKAQIESGKVSYHPDAIAACLQNYANAPCGSSDAVVMGCLAAIDGAVALGGACTEELECAGDARCDVGAACPGVCKPRLEPGEDCSLSRDCRSGLGCSVGPGVCAALAQQGEACRGPSAAECRAGLICVGAFAEVAGTCQALRSVSVGEPCGISSATVCAGGSACVIVGKADDGIAREICVATSSSKGPCSIGSQDSCPVGEYCPLTSVDLANGVYAATCRPLAKKGEACVSSGSACGATGVCAADGHCVELGKVGEACQNDQECFTNACVANVCQIDTGCL